MPHFFGRTHANRRHAPESAPEIGSNKGRQAPSHEEIAKLAYSHWEARGRPAGDSREDWLRAERELSNCRES